MFSQMTYEDKVAFFELLDEYFESRPHLLGGGGGGSGTPSRSPVASPSYAAAPSSGGGGRALPPPAPRSSAPLPPPSAPSPTAAGGEKPDFATRMVMSGLKMGASGASRGVTMISKNPQAMDALGKVGAAAIIKGTQAHLAGAGAQQGQGQADGAGTPPPPPGAKKGGGVSGLVSGKSFGHVDTSSKMSAFTSMWKDPQKQPSAPVANTYQPPALSANRGGGLPPPRRGAPIPTPEDEVVGGAEGQAQALYDYEGADSTDLGVQSGQIVNVIEKTSADWWQCEDGNGRRGLVPASYLKEI